MLRLCSCVVLLALPATAPADFWASQVMSYSAGANPATGMTDPQTALGEPTRFTGVGSFPGAVTVFNPPWMPTEIASLGVGGSLVVRFDTPIVNDPQNPYGLDLLVFGNAGYIDQSFPQGITNGTLFGAGHGRIEVSADNADWRPILGVEADGAFPTLGYSDLTDPYSPNPGSVLTDFTRPVNPALNAAGMTFAQIVAAYAGSGGGTGVDISATGLGSISYVRITNPNPSGTVEIDAFARVTPIPAPGALAAGLAVAACISRRRRRPCAVRTRLAMVAMTPALQGAPAAPQLWPMFAGSAQRTSASPALPGVLGSPRWIASAGPGGAPIAWSPQAGVIADRTRVFAVGRVGTQWYVVALGAGDGAVWWAAPVPAPHIESWSTPALDAVNQTILVAAGGVLTAIDAGTGSPRWQAPLARPVLGASPLVTTDRGPADRAFITDYDPLGGQSRLYCINLDPLSVANPFNPGEIVWSVPIGGSSGNTPAYDGATVYVAAATDESGFFPGRVLAFPTSATSPPPPLWVVANSAPHGFFGGVCITSPGAAPAAVLAASYAFAGTQLAANLVKLDAATGALLWSVPCNRTSATPIPLPGGRILLSGGIRGFGSAPSLELFQDNGTSASLLWDSALATWNDANNNGILDTGEYLALGSWTHQPIAAAAVGPGSGHLALAGAPSATAGAFSYSTDLYLLDLSLDPTAPGFIVSHAPGPGGTPAAAFGGVYSVGAAGLYALGPPPCYANCDSSTVAPALNVGDFGCFLAAYAAGDPYANCDGSTAQPVLNVGDFGCFLTRYAGGCP
ncbi:MAG: PQQ-binding-like beta-propeller repeat protein [Phycisphaerales bacterium]